MDLPTTRGGKWVAISDDVGSISYDPSSMSTDTQVADATETRALRQLLLEKTKAIDTMRTLLDRSEHAHRMSISGLCAVISQQQHIIEQNRAAMTELNAKFVEDSRFVRETLAKYLNDDKSPSAELQGEISPGLYVCLAGGETDGMPVASPQ